MTRNLSFTIRATDAGDQVIEIWDLDDSRRAELVGAIYSHANSVKIVSKYLVRVIEDPEYPPAVEAVFRERIF